jgi:lysophospholipase L1-like esterase
MAIISAANKEIAKFDDGKTVRVLDLTEKFLVDGKPTKDYQSDLLHLSQKGYEVWAAGLTPLLDEMTK